MIDPLPLPSPHYWSTSYYHPDNKYTMDDYLDNILPKDFREIERDGSFAVVEHSDGTRYELHASGNGDGYDHKVEVVRI